MKLSEAIREGAKQHLQNLGTFFAYDENGNITHSCAMGAAYVHILKLEHRPDSGITAEQEIALQTTTGQFLGQDMKHPVNNMTGSLEGVIVSLNDRYHWSREMIADWLESVGY